MANWLTFEKIRDWDFPVYSGFAYDWLSDDDIQAALADGPRLINVDPQIDWEDDRWLSACTTIPEERKHAYRVAALVRAFSAGEKMHRTINLDTFTNGRCTNCIANGHHRIRALQFLGVSVGPFGLSGLVDELERLVSIAGAVCPGAARHYFEDALLQQDEDDILGRRVGLATHQRKTPMHKTLG
ncbi:hypothetical protein [Burkholderia cenocepacia]|uniref:hypothetical protein n=1 Tax=Burkholderia cenocepacia TaxID=95486 RepID=UPI0007616618|nr:hypothetical protein [Burkholderia cenocepacia]KWU26275.1 hypothetical protein AS149_25120 [Burkholderia cenocepacia]